MSIPETIFNQLGGGRFVAFTGCKDFVGDKNSLRMSLPRNHSKANRLTVTYDYGTDTYSMRFWRFTPFRFDHKTGVIRPEKFTERMRYFFFCSSVMPMYCMDSRLWFLGLFSYGIRSATSIRICRFSIMFLYLLF